jgi:hypothetical protein
MRVYLFQSKIFAVQANSENFSVASFVKVLLIFPFITYAHYIYIIFLKNDGYRGSDSIITLEHQVMSIFIPFVS